VHSFSTQLPILLFSPSLQLPPYRQNPGLLTIHHGANPIIVIPESRVRFVETIASLQRRLTIIEAPAEDGLICTLALLLKPPRSVSRDSEGFVTASNPSIANVRCAIVHQFDRSGQLVTFYSETFLQSPAAKTSTNASAAARAKRAGPTTLTRWDPYHRAPQVLRNGDGLQRV
jgi:hypothetical protein